MKKKIFVYIFGSNEFLGMTKDQKDFWYVLGIVDDYWKNKIDLLV